MVYCFRDIIKSKWKLKVFKVYSDSKDLYILLTLDEISKAVKEWRQTTHLHCRAAGEEQLHCSYSRQLHTSTFKVHQLCKPVMKGWGRELVFTVHIQQLQSLPLT